MNIDELQQIILSVKKFPRVYSEADAIIWMIQQKIKDKPPLTQRELMDLFGWPKTTVHDFLSKNAWYKGQSDQNPTKIRPKSDQNNIDYKRVTFDTPTKIRPKSDQNPTKKRAFTKPTVEEIAAYCKERDNTVDPQQFYDSYEAKGWMIKGSKMKDWKASVRTWERSPYRNKELEAEKRKRDFDKETAQILADQPNSNYGKFRKYMSEKCPYIVGHAEHFVSEDEFWKLKELQPDSRIMASKIIEIESDNYKRSSCNNLYNLAYMLLSNNKTNIDLT